MDGTFTHIPKFHTQMFSIHAFAGQKLLLLVYVLIANKDRATYIAVLRQLKDKAAPNITLNPTTIHCDFESGNDIP